MKIKKIIATSILILSINLVYSQRSLDPKWSNKYGEKNYTEYEYIEIANKFNWKPRKDGRFEGSNVMFEKVFLIIRKH